MASSSSSSTSMASFSLLHGLLLSYHVPHSTVFYTRLSARCSVECRGGKAPGRLLAFYSFLFVRKKTVISVTMEPNKMPRILFPKLWY